MRERWKIVVAVVVVLMLTGAWWWTRVRPAPPPPAMVQAPAASSTRAPDAPSIAGEVPAPCNPIPKPPPLPASLSLKAPTLPAIVQALDASLGPEHKAFLLCFADEDALVARAHFGFGRWLRTALRLRANGGAITELRALGVRHPDDISAVIVRVYARSLRHQPLDVPDAVAKTRRMADISGVPQ